MVVTKQIFVGFSSEVDLDGTSIVTPELETFNLLTESGGVLLTEAGNNITIENNG